MGVGGGNGKGELNWNSGRIIIELLSTNVVESCDDEIALELQFINLIQNSHLSLICPGKLYLQIAKTFIGAFVV